MVFIETLIAPNKFKCDMQHSAPKCITPSFADPRSLLSLMPNSNTRKRRASKHVKNAFGKAARTS